MSWHTTPNATPFIPPLPSPGGGLLVPPVVPSHHPSQADNAPDWGSEPTMHSGAGAQYTPYTPHTPFAGTPYIPHMEDLHPPPLASAPPLAPATAPPGSYFPPPRNLPPNTHHDGANGLSADYTGYPTGPPGRGDGGGPPQGAGPQSFRGGGGGPPQGAGPQNFRGGGGGPPQGAGPQNFRGGGGGPPQGADPQNFRGGGPGFGGGHGFGGAPPGTPWGPPPWAGPPMPGAFPYTPFAHPQMMHPHTGYVPFQQPLPGAFGGHPNTPHPGSEWGPPVGYGPYTPGYGMTGMPGGMGTPWHGGGGLPPGPQPQGMADRIGAKLSEQWHRPDGWELDDNSSHKLRFTPGPNYGPVLEPFLLRAVNAQLFINPLLEPPDNGLKRPHIEWNMLFPTSTCHRSTDRKSQSWMVGREEPATFPRVTLVRLVCRNLPWMISVRAHNRSVGVTCGELIDDIWDNLYRHVSKEEMASSSKQRAITETYWYNRSTAHDVPGGRLGDGVRRVDWLLRHTGFGGIQRNDDVARAQSGGVVLPCTFELICEQKFAPDQDLRDHDSDHEHGSSRFSTRASRSRSRSRSRASPRVSIIE